MTYRIEGLAPGQFRSLRSLSDLELAGRRAMRLIADSAAGYPCRISLEDAREGEKLFLLNFVSHDVATPFRTSYAIYVGEAADEAAIFEDEVPPILARRTLGLRGFDGRGMLRAARLATPGEADAGIRALLESPEIASIHAHNAAHGCFLARIERT
jgi:hypothetical protein